MFIKTADYTVWAKADNGKQQYFIKYHGQTYVPPCEISGDVFAMYAGDFYHTLENQRNEQRRHLESASLESFDNAGELASRTAEDEDLRVSMCDVEAALATCTAVQQRRFNLHFVQGYSYVEIAKLENCDAAVVRRSVLAVQKKIKNIF